MTRVVKSVDQSGLDGPTCRMRETRYEKMKEMYESINEWGGDECSVDISRRH